MVAVAVGGVVGAEARYGLSLALPHAPGAWPWSTLLVNASGCVLIGVLMVLVTERVRVHPLTRPLLGVGVLGGYTTFSSYAVDVVGLVGAGRVVPAAGYAVATPLLALLAVAVGVWLTRRATARWSAGERR
ncbi:fluoride efflux transporter CrcB [Pseudonocardia sp. S2-4]|uniref:Fluoride-specific ion channel FluC n=1 Tax=Pseudonocardia humida TaxID=2800819 RepID=A0ABT0ZV43_9PSEU|nr:fluoride efflux transporter CrcB [Pseudonocardia humida]